MEHPFTVVLYVAIMVVCAYAVGYSSAMLDVHMGVFRPWLDSLKPGTATYWERAAEYELAWNRYVVAHDLLRPFRRWLRLGRPVPDSRRDIAAG